MLKAMYSGVSGMKAHQTRLDVIGNNIANVGTTAFKKSSTRLNDYFYQTMVFSSSPTNTIGGTNAGQVGTGVKVSAITKIMEQGGIQPTGRPSDLAIDGDGFFPVMRNGVVAYTRDGSFNLDTGSPDSDSAYGRLVTGDGYILQGNIKDTTKAPAIDGLGEIKIPLKAISPEDGTVQDVVAYNISKDGTIEFLLSDGQRTTAVHDIPKDAEVGKAPTTTPATLATSQQIEIVTFQNPAGLEAMGNNLFAESPNSGPAAEMASSVVIQGAIEMSNVDLAEEFTEMILATKAFQAASKMISTSDEILSEIINLKR